MAGRGGVGGVGGVAQLGLSRGQAAAHITGACSGGCGSQADAVFLYWIRAAAQGEGVSNAGGRGRGGGGRGELGEVQATGTAVGRCSETKGHREARSSAGGAWEAGKSRWRQCGDEVERVQLTTLTPAQSVIWQQAVWQAIQSRHLAHVPS